MRYLHALTLPFAAVLLSAAPGLAMATTANSPVQPRLALVTPHTGSGPLMQLASADRTRADDRSGSHDRNDRGDRPDRSHH